MSVPIVNIDDDVSSLIDKTPPKSDGVDLSELAQGGNQEQKQPEITITQKTKLSEEEKKQRNRDRMREYQRRKKQLRENGEAPPPRGLTPDAAERERKKQEETQKAPKIAPEAAARIVNTAYENALVAVLGEDGQLIDAEKQALDSALVEYLKTKDLDLPPGLALAFCYATVAFAKFNKPKSRERVASIWGYLRGKLSRKSRTPKQEA